MSASTCANSNRLEAQAIVRDAGSDWLELELDRATPCAGCSGLCLWSLRRRPTNIRVRNGNRRFMAGEHLILRVPAALVLKAAMLAYGLPLLSMCIGAILMGLGRSDASAVLGALLGLAIGIPLSSRLQRRVVHQIAGDWIDRDPVSS